MKQHVIVVPSDRLIIVDGTPTAFDFPSLKTHAIQWHNGTGEMEWRMISTNPLTLPTVRKMSPIELWEAEKARLEMRPRQPRPPALPNTTALKPPGQETGELANAFTKATCSLGFDIDANDAANRNVSGLVTLMEAEGAPESLQFCDYNNEIHTVTLADLRVMQQEIIANGSALYARKWALRDAINIAATAEELNAITISF